MKNLILTLIITLPLTLWGQEIITNKFGEDIILYENKTWDYYVNDNNLNIDSSELFSYFFDISRENIYKYGWYKSGKVTNFNHDSYEVLDYKGNHQCEYLIKDINGKSGFFVDRCDEYLNDLIDKKNLIETNQKNSKLNILGTSITSINSVGGVDLSISWKYLNKSKDIKYIYFDMLPYNTVGDPVKGKYDNGVKTGKITGPISSSNKKIISKWSTFWYNSTICCFKITKVKVEYMDGSKYTYVNELPKIFSENLKYYCF